MVLGIAVPTLLEARELALAGHRHTLTSMRLLLWSTLFFLQLSSRICALPHEAVSLVPRFKINIQNHPGLPSAVRAAGSSTAQTTHRIAALELPQSSDSPESPASLAHLRTPSSTSSGTWARTMEGFSSLQTLRRTPGPAHASPRSSTTASPPRLLDLHSEDFLSSLSRSSSSPRRDRETPRRPTSPARKKTSWWSRTKHVVRKPFEKCVGCVSRP